MLSNILNIEGVSLLPKEQQKAISGGYIMEPGTCAVLIYGSHPDTWGTPDSFTPDIFRNISLDTVNQALAASTWGGRYCCDSCDTASWY